MAIYQTGTKLEKHQIYVECLKEKLISLEKQKLQIEQEMAVIRQKIADNEDYVPPENCQ